MGDKAPKLILQLKDIRRNVSDSLFQHPTFDTILLNIARHKLDDYNETIHTNLQIEHYRGLDTILKQNETYAFHLMMR